LRTKKKSQLPELRKMLEQGFPTKTIAKKMKIKPQTISAYKCRFRTELGIGLKSAKPWNKSEPEKLTKIERGMKGLPEWINKGMKQQKFPPEGDPLHLKEQKHGGSLGGRVEYDHLSEESARMRDKTVYADEEVKEKGQRYNPHWDCFIDEDLEKKIPE